MKNRQREQTDPATGPEIDNKLSARLDNTLAVRFKRVVAASKRSKTSILEECLQTALPRLEKQYSKAA